MAPAPTIALRITLLARALRTRFDAKARSVGITRAQWRTIVVIGFSEGATQSQIAAKLEVNSVTAGRIIDKLAAVGCVERRADPVDRRVNRVYLTSHADTFRHRLSQLGAEEEEICLAGFTPEERQSLDSMLQRMVDNMAGQCPSRCRHLGR